MTSEPPCVPSEFAPVCAGPEAIAHGPHGALDAQVSVVGEASSIKARHLGYASTPSCEIVATVYTTSHILIVSS